jgi:hypothetical protein
MKYGLRVVNLQSILGQDTKSLFVVDSKHDTHRCKNITKHGIHTHTHAHTHKVYRHGENMGLPGIDQLYIWITCSEQESKTENKR